MTEAPQSIGQEQTIASAEQLMRQLDVRHLPVLHGGRLVGILSQRDVQLIHTLKDADPARVLVEEAMSQAPYRVAPTEPLGRVASEMATNKYGAALVMDGSRLVGVFTTVDALKILAEELSDA
ncbi:MAG: CBS domain-containing protein [Polyangiaceae bacterium]|nr:CBS domain-containing protein [Polyangiaceae bacterium]MCW5789371.1 CBS domain-containing protein [Polyangiaceae bacterium]